MWEAFLLQHVISADTCSLAMATVLGLATGLQVVIHIHTPM